MVLGFSFFLRYGFSLALRDLRLADMVGGLIDGLSIGDFSLYLASAATLFQYINALFNGIRLAYESKPTGGRFPQLYGL